MTNWRIRAGRGAVCDFKSNYDFYFKWLTDKVMSCFIISDEEPEDRTMSINWDYAKMNLILDGQICITDFNEKLYACIGNRGGAVDEYYLPTQFLIANPILGSKQVEIGRNGVVIYNTKVDKFVWTGSGAIFSGGLYDLVAQTATLLADNIISINCVQVNARVSTFFTADSEAQAVAGEATLRKLYAGAPYLILRSDMIDKLNVNPVNAAAATQNITELIELHNYIISSFFQNIGIKSNNVMKRERLISDEIDTQMDYLQINILEILAAWQKGLDEVNEMYNTKFTVKLNPVLLPELLQECAGTSSEPEPEPQPEPEPAAEPEPEPEPDIKEEIEDREKQVEDIVNIINDSETKVEEGEDNEPTTETMSTDAD